MVNASSTFDTQKTADLTFDTYDGSPTDFHPWLVDLQHSRSLYLEPDLSATLPNIQDVCPSRLEVTSGSSLEDVDILRSGSDLAVVKSCARSIQSVCHTAESPPLDLESLTADSFRDVHGLLWLDKFDDFNVTLSDIATPSLGGEPSMGTTPDLLVTPRGQKTRRAVQHTKSDWENIRPFFLEYYLVQELDLKKTMYLLEHNHGFYATEQMYKKRISRWGAFKNAEKAQKHYVDTYVAFLGLYGAADQRTQSAHAEIDSFCGRHKINPTSILPTRSSPDCRKHAWRRISPPMEEETSEVLAEDVQFLLEIPHHSSKRKRHQSPRTTIERGIPHDEPLSDGKDSLVVPNRASPGQPGQRVKREKGHKLTTPGIEDDEIAEIPQAAFHRQVAHKGRPRVIKVHASTSSGLRQNQDGTAPSKSPLYIPLPYSAQPYGQAAQASQREPRAHSALPNSEHDKTAEISFGRDRSRFAGLGRTLEDDEIVEISEYLFDKTTRRVR